MTISTSVWDAQHPHAGRNIQHFCEGTKLKKVEFWYTQVIFTIVDNYNSTLAAFCDSRYILSIWVNFDLVFLQSITSTQQCYLFQWRVETLLTAIKILKERFGKNIHFLSKSCSLIVFPQSTTQLLSCCCCCIKPFNYRTRIF